MDVITTFLPEPDMEGYFLTENIVLDMVIAVIVGPLIETLIIPIINYRSYL